MPVKKRGGKLLWRRKKAVHGRKGSYSLAKGRLCKSNK